MASAAEVLSAGAYIAPFGIIASILIKKTLKFKWIVVVGWVFTAVGTGVNVS